MAQSLDKPCINRILTKLQCYTTHIAVCLRGEIPVTTPVGSTAVTYIADMSVQSLEKENLNFIISF